MSRRHTSARQRELEAQALADWGDGPVADILAGVTPLADDPPPVPCRGSKDRAAAAAKLEAPE